jgi:hypothetical protein
VFFVLDGDFQLYRKLPAPNTNKQSQQVEELLGKQQNELLQRRNILQQKLSEIKDFPRD